MFGLDAHITGNYGEDLNFFDPEEDGDEEEEGQ